MSETDRIITRKYDAPCGSLLLGSFGSQLCLCDWMTERHHSRVCNRLCHNLGAEMTEGSSPVIELAAPQLDEYFAGRRKSFTVPLLFVGTEFQKTVWEALLSIPYATTLSYAALAKRIGRPSSVRAVANANGANAISIFIPCHRIIGINGTLTGYAGGLETKRYLLSLEQHPGSLFNNY